MPRPLLLVHESLLKPRSSSQREYLRMSNLACFYSAPLAVSCGCGRGPCDPELEAGGTKLTWIPYVHLYSVHPGRDLQDLSPRPSSNPPHMKHCYLGTSVDGHGSSHRIQLAHGISATRISVLITAVFSKPFSLLLFLGLAELQGESSVIAEGFTAEHCLHF